MQSLLKFLKKYSEIVLFLCFIVGFPPSTTWAVIVMDDGTPITQSGDVGEIFNEALYGAGFTNADLLPEDYVGGELCAVDLNGDGAVDGEGEIASCINSFCPIQLTKCEAGSSEPRCDGEGELDPETDMCVSEVSITCPANWHFDKEIDRCVYELLCSQGGVYNPVTDRCEIIIGSGCADGYVEIEGQDICVQPISCGSGVLNVETMRCEKPAELLCPEGYVADYALMQCSATPICPEGSDFSTGRDRCEKIAVGQCEEGYVYHEGENLCVAESPCLGEQVLNSETGQCEAPLTVTCPPGYKYDDISEKCIDSTPDCAVGGWFDFSLGTCVSDVLYPHCETGYTYSLDLGMCVAEPTCKVGEIGESGNCEVPSYESCPWDYTEELGTNTCFAEPSCRAGEYSHVFNYCDLGVTPSCPDPYIWDTMLDACVTLPDCPTGSIYMPETNKCQVNASITCEAGYAYNPSSGMCESNPSCLSPGEYDLATNLCLVESPGPICPNGFTYSVSLQKCVTNPICLNGQYNYATNRCEHDQYHNCPSGFTYSTVTAKCERSPYCSQGTYSAQFNVCLTDFYPQCPAGYSFDGASDRCERGPDCNEGSYDKNYDVCRKAITKACPAGYRFNSARNRCEMIPVCTVGRLDKNDNRCEVGAPGICPSGYYYSTGDNRCERQTTCNYGTYSARYNVCQSLVVKTCPSGYRYSSYKARCEKTPVCGIGQLDKGDNRCEVATTGTCPSGYSYSSADARCEKNAICGVGGYDPTSNRCEVAGQVENGSAPNCPSGYSYNNALNSCTDEVSVVDVIAATPTLLCAASEKTNSHTYGTETATGTSLHYRGAYTITFNNSCIITYINGSHFHEGCSIPVGSSKSWRMGRVAYKRFYNKSYYGYSCPAGYSLNGKNCYGRTLQVVTAAATCPSGTVLNESANLCVLPVDKEWHCKLIQAKKYTCNTTPGGSCQVGDTHTVFDSVCNLVYYDHDTSYSHTHGSLHVVPNTSTYIHYGRVYKLKLDNRSYYTCPAGFTLDSVHDRCIPPENSLSCSGDQLIDLNENVCYYAPMCDYGGLDGVQDVCWASYSRKCPSGTVMDSAQDICSSLPYCSSRGTYDNYRDKCYTDVSLRCGPGMDYNSARQICVAPANCPSGGRVDGSQDVCYTNYSPSCPSGTTWSKAQDLCVAAPVCGNGGRYDTARDVCYVDYNIDCPPGMHYVSGLASCASPAGCPSGTLDPGENLCYTTYTPKCGRGTVYDSVSNKCVSNASCFSGVLDVSKDKCWLNVPKPCASNYVTEGNEICVKGPQCQSPGVFTASADRCMTDINGYRCDSGYAYDSSLQMCKRASTCTGLGYLNTNSDFCQHINGLACPNGYHQEGALCTIVSEGCPDVSAASAIFNSGMSSCELPEYDACGDYFIDKEQDQCFTVVACGDGSLNGDTDRCEAMLGEFCPTGFLFIDGVCQRTPICPTGGTLDESGLCVYDVLDLCAQSYSYSALEHTCMAPPTCGGGTLNETYRRCEIDPGLSCPLGMTPDLATMTCTGIPECQGTGSYNETLKMCVTETTLCPRTGMMFDAERRLCYEPILCGDAGTYEPAEKKCVAYPTPDCGAANGVGEDRIVTTPPDCYGNSYDSQLNSCLSEVDYGCIDDYTMSEDLTYCISRTACASGLEYSVLTGRCETPATGECEAGYNLNLDRGRCEKNAPCLSGTLFDDSVMACVAPYDGVECPDGAVLDETWGLCLALPNCGPASLDGTTGQCFLYYNPLCPTGTTFDGEDSCFKATACSGEDVVRDNICVHDLFPICSQGIYNEGINRCLLPPNCDSGNLNPDTDQCEHILDQLSWVADSKTLTCFAYPDCDGGLFNPHTIQCEMFPQSDCGFYDFDEEANRCFSEMVCPEDPEFMYADSMGFSTDLEVCSSDAVHECEDGYIWNATDMQCQSEVVCDAGIYDVATDTCSGAVGQCPIDSVGVQYPCVALEGDETTMFTGCNQGLYNSEIDKCEYEDLAGNLVQEEPNVTRATYCSPNPCVSLAEDDITNVDADLKSYKDDGPRDENGDCLGDIFIFNGEGKECFSPSMRTGYQDCCTMDMEEDVPDSIETAKTTIAVYDALNGIYAAYQAYTGVSEIMTLAQTAYQMASTAITGTTVAATTTAGTVGATTGATTGAATGAGGGMASAMGAALVAFAWAIVIAVIIYVIVSCIVKGCPTESLETAMASESGRSHYVGSYCKSESFLGCMQRAEVHCTFKTKLARIIHEQGRPQLESFGPDGGWGIAESPYCRGFSPVEFQMLDFSAIDLSEYFESIKTVTTVELEGAAMDNVNNYMNSVQGQTWFETEDLK